MSPHVGPYRSPSSSSSTLMSTHSSSHTGNAKGKSNDDPEKPHEGIHIPPPTSVPTVPSSDTNGKFIPTDTDEKDETDETDRKMDTMSVIPGKPPDDKTERKGEKDIYDRFSPARKRLIVACVTFAAFISPVTTSILLPAVPQMAEDLHTTPAVINYTTAIFVVTIGIAPLLWSPLSGFYGRRPVYLASMPIHSVASIGVALSQNVGALIGTRILQGFGGSCVLAVGAGSIGDIFRANAMGWYYSGALMGPSFAPLIGGLFSQYTKANWRSTQYFLAGTGVLSVILNFCFLPETSHPPLPHHEMCVARGKKFVLYRFNPFTSLGLYRWPNICAIAFVSSCVLLETYCFIIPLGTIFQNNYGVTNVAVAGSLYIANGGGNFIGARIAGPLADKVTARYIKKRGYRRPEDRLRASLIPSGIILPLACIGYGWLIQTGAGGIGSPLVMMIFSAIALMMILTPLNTYLVDCMQKRSAETIAVNNFMRYIFSAAASAFVLPLADAIGWGLTMTLAAVISWLAFGTLIVTLRYGHIWREKANNRYGMTGAADEMHAETGGGDDKEETKVGVISEDGRDHDHEHEHEHSDEPGHLISAPALKNFKTTKGATTGLARTSSAKGDMPPVEEVLRRTVSLSGASAHGG